jgi:hypothetical protein
MELRVNGAKIANFPDDRINTNLFIQDFSTVTIYEIDSKGRVYPVGSHCCALLLASATPDAKHPKVTLAPMPARRIPGLRERGVVRQVPAAAESLRRAVAGA